jgi:hypothetical protein
MFRAGCRIERGRVSSRPLRRWFTRSALLLSVGHGARHLRRDRQVTNLLSHILPGFGGEAVVEARIDARWRNLVAIVLQPRPFACNAGRRRAYQGNLGNLVAPRRAAAPWKPRWRRYNARTDIPGTSASRPKAAMMHRGGLNNPNSPSTGLGRAFPIRCQN